MLGPGDEVVVPADEFTSTPLPAARRQGARRGQSARCRSTTWRRPIGPATTLVAFSLVQMQTGKMADLEAIIGGSRAATARGS